MEYIEEFTLREKNFIYIDLSGVKSNYDFCKRVGAIMPVIEKYPLNSLYTITNVENTRFDSESKNSLRDYLKHNSLYVKYGTVIGMDGIKKIMAKSMFQVAGRTNMHFAFTKEQAIEWLMKQD